MLSELLQQVGFSALVFLILLVVLNVLIYKPIIEIIKLRRAQTKGNVEHAEVLRQETAVCKLTRKHKMLEARQQGLLAREALKKQGAKEGEAIISAAKKETKERHNFFQKEIKARQNVMNETLLSGVDKYADEMANKIFDVKNKL